MPLLIAAGYLEFGEGHTRLQAFVDELYGPAERMVDVTDLASETLAGEDVSQSDLEQTAFAAFLADGFGRDVASGLDDPDSERDLREVLRAWPALTPGRRRMLVAIAADQEVLSQQERMPNPPGRLTYDVEIRSSESGDDDGNH